MDRRLASSECLLRLLPDTVWQELPTVHPSLSALQLKAAYYTNCVPPTPSQESDKLVTKSMQAVAMSPTATRLCCRLHIASPCAAAPLHCPFHSQQPLHQHPQPPLPLQAPLLRRPLPAVCRHPLGSGRQWCHGCECAASRTRGSLAACCRCPCDLSIAGRAHQQLDRQLNHASRAAGPCRCVYTHRHAGIHGTHITLLTCCVCLGCHAAASAGLGVGQRRHCWRRGSCPSGSGVWPAAACA